MILNNDWNQLLRSIKELKSESMELILSENLLELLVAGEDHRFWLHYGVDHIGLLRAAWKSKFCNNRQGGSTIAMQLVRTITGQYEISYKRKLKEIYLATKLTLILDKSEILKLYLSVAYFGWNMHGIEQACSKLSLNKALLSDFEAASIIARLKYPEPKYKDSIKIKKIDSRTNHIITRFHKLNPQEQYGTI